MTEQGRPGAGPSVCPFVALAEDRDRRGDSPGEGNRCYAEPAPRQRDMVYQADYCYSERFSQCSVFLSWAARNAAEPAYVNEATSRASRSDAPADDSTGTPAGDDPVPVPTPEDGLFGPADASETSSGGNEQIDWVSASAWAEAPWDERAELEAAELAEDEPEELEVDEADTERPEEDTKAPRVPAAVPMRRRKKTQSVIRSRGSGEWYYADPPGSEPLVSRRSGVAPPILLAVLGLLVAALVVFMIPTLLFGGGDDAGTAAAPSPSAEPTVRPLVTSPPVVVTAPPTEAPSPSPTTRPETHKVKRGETLTGIARRYGVKPAHIVCLNNMRDRDIVMLGVIYAIPPEGFKCPPNWRKQN